MIIGVATFCSLNKQEVNLRYFFGWATGPFPLFLLILVALLAGSATGLLMGWGERRKLRGELKKLRRRTEELSKGEEIQSIAEGSRENRSAS